MSAERDAHSVAYEYLGKGFVMLTIVFGTRLSQVNIKMGNSTTDKFTLIISGFGSNGKAGFLGNNGLWDEALALNFTRQIIHNFGGDVNRITVWGNSAGGASTGALVASTHTRGWCDLMSYKVI